MPVHHLFKGQTGCKGHSAAFRQDIAKVASILPNLSEDVVFIKKFKNTKEDSGEKKFIIRKNVVLNALRWLKIHNKHYKNILLDESRLDWMEGENKVQLPNIKNKTILYKGVEFAKEYNRKTFFNAETINGIPQEDTRPASQVLDLINSSKEINYSVEGVV